MKIQPLVKEWLDTHREEYCAFANEESKRDRSGFQQIFQYAQFAAPTFADAVMARMSDNREEDFIGSLEKLLEDSDLAAKLVDEFQSQKPESIVPALLAWLYFGNSWEMMVAYNEEPIKDKNSSFFYRCMARMIIRFAIKRSIKIEHRTKEDWENFRKSQKSVGSLAPVTDDAIEEFKVEDSTIVASEVIADEETAIQPTEPKKRGRKKVRVSLNSLLPNDTERMKDRIYEFLKLRSSGNDLAMLYIFLHEESHIYGSDITTFHNALTEHYYLEQKLVGLRGVQKAHQFLTTPMMGGKRMIDMGQDKKNLDNIKVHFAA
ncbi:MAG: hypothetical protein HDR74_05220 [Bacteroides sp.]|nr:hypothetical protein [Bacteroides sp.]